MAGDPQLFAPLDIRGLTLANRIVFGPMATYSAVAGTVGDWHLAHLSRFATGGSALIFLEAAAILRQNRMFQGAVGIWQDEQVGALRRMTEFLHQHGVAAGLQLACRGGSMLNQRPWDEEADDGVDPHAANLMLWDMDPDMIEAPADPAAHEFEREMLDELLDGFGQAARRAAESGFDALEIHGGRGTIPHAFLSPTDNRRGDEYGGVRESRIVFPVEVVNAVRDAWPEDRPLFYRMAPVDNSRVGWRVEDSVAFAGELGRAGVDVIDLASGASPIANADGLSEGAQATTARAIRRDAAIPVMVGGGLDGHVAAEAAIDGGYGDLVALVRPTIWNPNWPLHAADSLGIDPEMAAWQPPYGWALRTRSGGDASQD